MGYKYK